MILENRDFRNQQRWEFIFDDDKYWIDSKTDLFCSRKHILNVGYIYSEAQILPFNDSQDMKIRLTIF